MNRYTDIYTQPLCLHRYTLFINWAAAITFSHLAGLSKMTCSFVLFFAAHHRHWTNTNESLRFITPLPVAPTCSAHHSCTQSVTQSATHSPPFTTFRFNIIYIYVLVVWFSLKDCFEMIRGRWTDCRFDLKDFKGFPFSIDCVCVFSSCIWKESEMWGWVCVCVCYQPN